MKSLIVKLIIGAQLLLGWSNFMAAQCPKEIICHPAYGLGLKYDLLPPNFDTRNAYLDFGGGDNRNGYYSGESYIEVPPNPDLDNIVFFNVPCTGDLGNLKIRFNDANHTYCTNATVCSEHVRTFDYAHHLDPIFKPYMSNNNCTPWLGDCGLNGTVYRSGRVSIGTEKFTKGYLLSVAGQILTEQYKVQKCGRIWCDYVFEDTYPLMPLSEVKAFIDKNGHLPKTKPASQIQKEGGVEVGETLLMQQEKIEEIFLHLIDLEKQLQVTINKQ